MKCLAVNTANTVLSVALQVDGKDVYFHETPETRDQGNLLINHAQKGLTAAGLSFDDLDLLAIVTGPGSFTGIRIGIAALRGLALASGKPLIGLSSFELFAEDVAGSKNIIAIESWREELYFHLDGQSVNEKPEDFASKLTAGNYFISGDARDKLHAVLPQSAVSGKNPDARDLARLAVEKFSANGVPSESPVPFYLRDADVSFSKNNRKTEGL